MMAVLMMAMSFTACSDDNDGPNNDPLGPYHFDITVTVGQQGGMSRKVTTIMQSVDSLENPDKVINFVGTGGEINAKYSMETILKGKYYYQVPFTPDRFTKFTFENDQVQVVQEQKFVKNTYATRSYTHAWINDNTLVIMAANGNLDKIIWTKLNTDDMTIIDEGTLNLNLTEGYKVFTTSGLLAYRQSDNKLFYFYYQKTLKRNGVTEPYFHVVTIDANSMEVLTDKVNSEANEMAASAYGELLQQTTFFDENDNLYVACFDNLEDGTEQGKLLRIKKGEDNFESGYNATPAADGKLLTVQYLGNGKVFAYSRCDKEGTTIDDYSHYYSVIDLNSKTRKRMAFDGEQLAYSSGRFAQRSAYLRKAGKMFFGVNTKDEQPRIYVYDVKKDKVTKGAAIAEGYFFEQIRLVEE